MNTKYSYIQQQKNHFESYYFDYSVVVHFVDDFLTDIKVVYDIKHGHVKAQSVSIHVAHRQRFRRLSNAKTKQCYLHNGHR